MGADHFACLFGEQLQHSLQRIAAVDLETCVGNLAQHFTLALLALERFAQTLLIETLRSDIDGDTVKAQRQTVIAIRRAAERANKFNAARARIDRAINDIV